MMDTNLIRQLLDKRDALDQEIQEAVGGKERERKPAKCSKCGGEGHNARACTKPE